MDYGIIFLIIIVIVIIIAIILIIIANRNNVTNILASLPSYRIQNFDNVNTANINYLGLKNVPNFSPNQTAIPITNIDFWIAFICSGLSSDDPMGIWKIENANDPKAPVNSGSEVFVVNYVYNLQSLPSLGYLNISGNIGSNLPFSAGFAVTNAMRFVYTITGTNLFTLHAKVNNVNLPIIIDRTNNLFLASTNVNVKPTTFRLVLQQQPQQ
jgi:hypothetical protein